MSFKSTLDNYLQTTLTNPPTVGNGFCISMWVKAWSKASGLDSTSVADAGVTGTVVSIDTGQVPVEITIDSDVKIPTGGQITVTGATGATELNDTFWTKRVVDLSSTSVVLYLYDDLGDPVDGSGWGTYDASSGSFEVQETNLTGYDIEPWAGIARLLESTGDHYLQVRYDRYQAGANKGRDSFGAQQHRVGFGDKTNIGWGSSKPVTFDKWHLITFRDPPWDQTGCSNGYIDGVGYTSPTGGFLGSDPSLNFDLLLLGRDGYGAGNFAPVYMADVSIWDGGEQADLDAIHAALWNGGAGGPASSFAPSLGQTLLWYAPLVSGPSVSIGAPLTEVGTPVYDNAVHPWEVGRLATAPGGGIILANDGNLALFPDPN